MTLADAEQLAHEFLAERATTSWQWAMVALCKLSAYHLVDSPAQPARGIALGRPTASVPITHSYFSELKCASLVRQAEAGSSVHLEAAIQLAGEFIEQGKPLPHALRRLHLNISRGRRPKKRRGRRKTTFRDFFLRLAIAELKHKGCNEQTALLAVHKVAGRLKILSNDHANFKKWYRSVTKKNTDD